MKIIQLADLHCTLAGADKVYHCAISESDGSYTVDFAYGRRLSTLTRGTKTSLPVSLEKAQKIFTKLVSEKTGKGYVNAPGISGIVFVGQMEEGSSKVAEAVLLSACDKVSTGIFAQLLNAIDEDEAQRLIEDPLWGAMEKKNGKRLLVQAASGDLIGINRKSFVVPLSPLVAASVSRIDRPILLDGESIGDTLYCFGLLDYEDRDLRMVPYLAAYNILLEVLAGHTGKGLEIVPLAITTQEKRDLYDRMKKEKKEGVVFKRLDMPHSPDRPASGGPHLKRKFTESASVIVLAVNDKRSVKMGVFEKGDTAPTFVGNVTIPANYEIPQAGDIVEVEYLYAYKGGSLFQPVYRGRREDINPEDCTAEQLKYCNVSVENEAA